MEPSHLLNISKPLSAAKIQAYFKSEYTSADAMYFSQKGQLIGEWNGKLAAEFGLIGAVTEAEFMRLAEGQHPATGEQLVKHRDTIRTKTGEEMGHRAGFDLTIGAPKTISLTGLVGCDPRVLEAHQEAVRTALKYAESYTQARMGGNKAAQTTSQWLAATFEHDTARPIDGRSDPHLHTHVVMFNMTRDAAGQIRSVEPCELFRIQSAITTIYQAELAVKLKALGYELEHGKNFSVEIAGYSSDYREASSRRRSQITSAMETKGIAGAESAERIAHQAREAKISLPKDEQLAIHRSEAEKYGNQPDRIVAQANERREQLLSPGQRNQVAHDAVTFAKHRLSERTAVFDHFEIVRDSLRYGMGSIQLRDVNAAFDDRLRTNPGEFIETHHYRETAPGERYTTPELQRAETEVLEFVQAGIGQTAPINRSLTKDEFRERYREDPETGRKGLNHGQLRLVWNSINSPDRVVGINGGAGTGKTTLLRPLRAIAEQNGYETRGVASTSGAAKELASAGLETETLQAFLLRKNHKELRPRAYFIDESSLVDSEQMQKFVQHLKTRPEDRVFLVGDIRQHQSVGAGRIFEELQQGGMTTFRLDKTVRQKTPEALAVVTELKKGLTEQALNLLHDQDRIREIPNKNRRYEAIAKEYVSHPGTLVVSPDNESRQAINAAVRSELRKEGHLSATEYRAMVMVNRQDMTTTDRKLAATYHIGNMVRFARASKEVGVAKGEMATVYGVDHATNMLTLKKQNGDWISYNPAKVATTAQVYQPDYRGLSVGDKIQFTAPWKERKIANRETAEVMRIDQRGNIAVSLDSSNRTVQWNIREFSHLDHGYAMTSYSAQGITVDRVILQVAAEDSRTRQLVDKTLAYVALSRARHEMTVYTDSIDALPHTLARWNRAPKSLSTPEIEQYLSAEQRKQKQQERQAAITR